MPALDFATPYPSARMPVMARNLVATSQPLAAAAGVDALRAGGNAVDAAVATAIALAVVEPSSNGIGGDAFAMVWDGARLHGLNASGRSPAAARLADFDGRDAIPLRGWDAVTVPGCVSAWAELSRRFGALPFARLFDAAIGYARDGYAVAPVTAAAWAGAAAEIDLDAFPDFASFLPHRRAPCAGEAFRFPAQAETLEAIAQSDGESFYRGALAEKIAAAADAADAAGAKLTREDLAAHQNLACDQSELLSLRYDSRHCGAIEVHEMPPNGQGLAALIALGIIAQHNITNYDIDSPDFFHLQIEAMKLALADAHRYIADPDHLEFPPQALLAPDYLAQRAAQIDMQRAGDPGCGAPARGGTVLLTTADARGMMVSFIQSNFWNFGSGIVVPGTGINLHNRGIGFNLQRGHPNCFGGAKRPFHTILPGFITRGGEALMAFGMMGGPMQAQGHTQLVIRVCDYGQNPQSASDAPRWQVVDGNNIALEDGVPAAVRDELARRGHRLHSLDPNDGAQSMGGAQLIYRDGETYIGGSDHRKDGLATGF